MVLPEKHVTLAESLLGLGAFLIGELQRPRSADQLYLRVVEGRHEGTLPAFHDFDSVLLAILLLYSVGILEADEGGILKLCAS